MAESSPNWWKTLLEKEKLLFTSNFSFSRSVFKRLVLQTRKSQGLFGNGLNHVISVISIALRETTLTISDTTGKTVLVESEIMRVVSLSTTEISEITRLKIRSSGWGTLTRYLLTAFSNRGRFFFFFLLNSVFKDCSFYIDICFSVCNDFIRSYTNEFVKERCTHRKKYCPKIGRIDG